jgi:hypothetical protein
MARPMRLAAPVINAVLPAKDTLTFSIDHLLVVIRR